MSATPEPSFLCVGAEPAQSDGKVPLTPFLTITLLFPMMIVAGNFALGVVTPITGGPEDDMSMLDSVWRLVQGQDQGIDFHDPLGFGFFQLAAALWRLLGPHYYVLHSSVALFALIIVFCAYAVAKRQLRNALGLAALFV